MKRIIGLALLLFAGVTAAHAQTYNLYQTCQLQTAQGQAVAGAQVYFLTQPANTQLLSPQAQVYASSMGTPVSQPIYTNGLGTCTAYLAAGTYTVVYISPYTGTLVYPDQVIGGGGGGGAAAGAQYAVQFAGSSANFNADNAIQTSTDHSIITAWPKVNARDSLFALGWTSSGSTASSCVGVNGNPTGYADPTGTYDSTCAINSAIAYAQAQNNNLSFVNAAIYFSSGLYKISSALRVESNLMLIGDVMGSSTIEQTSTTANAVTFLPATGLTLGDSNPGGITNLTIQGTGHLGSGTLLELDNTVAGTFRNLRLNNGGGRGLNLEGSSERNKFYNLHIDAVRWPIQLSHNANENHWFGLNIANPGADTSGYCWGAMCVNGQYPISAPSNTNVVSVSQTDSTHVTVTLSGTIPAGLQVGHYGALAGVSEDSTYNQSPLLITALSQISGSQYTVTMFEYVTTPGPYTDGTWTIVWRPDIHQAVWVEAVNDWFHGGSLKSTQFIGGFGFHASEDDGEDEFYIEGYPYNGEPRMNSAIVANGPMPLTTTTAAITATSTSIPVASTMWFPDYINDPQDLSYCSSYFYVLMPADAIAGSSVQSTAFPSVTKGTQETVYGCFSSDGAFHVDSSRNGKAWPAGSIIERNVVSDYGSGATAEHNHMQSVDPPSVAGFTTDCNDQSFTGGARSYDDYPIGYTTCAEVVAGKAPDGYIGNPNGASAGAIQGGTLLHLNDNAIYTGGTAVVGEGTLKAFNDAAVFSHTIQNANTYLTAAQIAAGTAPNNQIAGMPYQNILYGSATGMGGITTPVETFNGNELELGDQHFFGNVYAGTGVNPGMNFGSDGTGFSTSYCYTDAGTVASAHALNRYCFEGGPYFTSGTFGFITQSWNGTTWVTNNVIGPNGDTFNVPVTVTGALTPNGGINNSIVPFNTTYPTTIAVGTQYAGEGGAGGVVNLPTMTQGQQFVINNSASGNLTFTAPTGHIYGTGATTFVASIKGSYTFEMDGSNYSILSYPTPSIRAGTVTISGSTTAAVTFATAMPSAPTSCALNPSASSATTGQPFATSLSTTGFTANVPVSGTLAMTYQCVVNNAN